MIVNHRLTTAPFVASPNMGGPLHPELLILHYTVSWPASAVIAGFKRADVRASAHLVLDLDGTFTQMVPLDRQAWHAGNSTWNGRKGCNGFALGIEIVNPGPVFRNTDGWQDVNKRTWLGPTEPHEPPPGFPTKWTHWAAYSEAQLASLETVCRELCREYAIREVVGHSDVSSGRKFDPGPAFPMDRVRRACGLVGDDALEPTKPDFIAPPIDPRSLPVLRVGSTGEHVRLLQERLRYWGRAVTVDGSFGPATQAQVRAFQVSRQLDPDGIVGAVSWALLLKEMG